MSETYELPGKVYCNVCAGLLLDLAAYVSLTRSAATIGMSDTMARTIVNLFFAYCVKLLSMLLCCRVLLPGLLLHLLLAQHVLQAQQADHPPSKQR